VTQSFVAAPTPHDIALSFSPALLDLRHEIELPAARRRVFDALLRLGAWWPARVRTGSHVVLEPRVGGRLFENCDDGCGVLLGNVVRLVMPEEFVIEGSFGMTGLIAARWSVLLRAAGHERSAIDARFMAFGALAEGERAAASARWDSTYAALAHYLAA